MASPVGLGQSSWASMKDEASYGADVGSTYAYARINDESVAFDPTTQDMPGHSTYHTQQWNSKDDVQGILEPEGHYAGIFNGKMLKHLFGGYTFTADTGPGGPATGCNQHVFTPAVDLGDGFTCEVSKADIPTNQVVKCLGGMVRQGTISCSQDGLMRFVYDCIMKTFSPGTARSGSPTFPGHHPVIHHHFGDITLVAETVGWKEFSLVFNNQLVQRFLEDKATRQPFRSQRRVVEGNITAELEDMNLVNKMIAGTQGSFTITADSGEQIAASGENYGMTLTVATAHLRGVNPVVNNEGAIDLPISFRAFGSTELILTLYNDDSTYA